MEMKNPNTTQWRKWLRRAVITVSLATISFGLFFFSLPWLLIRPPEPVPSDVILYLGSGDRSETNQYVVDLYHQGLAKKIVCASGQITWNTFPADFVREQLLQLGVPAADVTTFHTPRAECVTDVVSVFLNLFKQEGWQRVLVVVNPITSRTTQRVFGDQFAQAQINLAITYSPAERADLRGLWWRKHKQTQMVIQQAIETVMDLLYPRC
jgi:hypothetical protein